MRQVRVPLLLFVCTVLLYSCTEENYTIINSPDKVYGPLDSIINTGGELTYPYEIHDTAVVSTDLTYDESGWYVCQRKRINVSENPDEFPLFDPNSEVIFPGNLLQGEYLDETPPRPIPLKRSSGTVVMTLVNGANSVSRHVDEVCLSSVMDAQNQIILDNPGTLPARFNLIAEEVQSEQQLEFSLRGYFSSSFASVRTALSFSTEREYNRFLVKLNQSFYTMAFEMPDNADLIFDESVSPDDLSRYVYSGNPAVYVSSVTYGRMFYLLIESTESKTDMEASIKASFSGIVASGGGGSEVKFVSELENVQIKAFALGGEQEAMFHAISSDFDTMRDFLAEGGKIGTGVPISYVMRSVDDPSRIVKMNLTTEYEVVDCHYDKDDIPRKIFWYTAATVEKNNFSALTLWPDEFGSDRTAKPDSMATAGYWYAKPSIVSTEPGVQFAERTPGYGYFADHATPDYLVDGQMKIDGPSLVGTDYTIFAVLRPLPGHQYGYGDLTAEFPNYFIEGVGTAGNDNLAIGFTDHTQVRMGHDDQNALVADLPFNAYYQIHLYTFRFSQTDGMAVYIDGEPEPIATAPALTEPLRTYPSPKIGSSCSRPRFRTDPLIGETWCFGWEGGAMTIMDLKAYGVAVSDEQRIAEANRLLTKHSL